MSVAMSAAQATAAQSLMRWVSISTSIPSRRINTEGHRGEKEERPKRMKIEKIDHICFAVKDLEETKRAYREDLG